MAGARAGAWPIPSRTTLPGACHGKATRPRHAMEAPRASVPLITCPLEGFLGFDKLHAAEEQAPSEISYTVYRTARQLHTLY